MGGGKSFTSGDWKNLATGGLAGDEDTRESRVAEADAATAQAEMQAMLDRPNKTGQALQGSGGASFGDVESEKKKKRTRSRGTTAAAIPTTGLSTGGDTGLGGI